MRGTGAIGGALAYGAISFVFQLLAGCAAAILVVQAGRPPGRTGGCTGAREARERLERRIERRPAATRGAMVPVAVVGGSPAAVWLWHVETRRQGLRAHLRFVLLVSVSLGLFSALQGALVGWGVDAPIPILLAVLVGATVLAVIHVGRRPARRDSASAPVARSRRICVVGERRDRCGRRQVL
ncbi:MAG: hypothetical protein JST64_12190 [Actinobacteria bacterium]|nr:hypothetical protein [Actinomycetota bacterium]